MLEQNEIPVQMEANTTRGEAKKLTSYFLPFTILFAVFIMGPPFLGYTFPLFPLMKISDVFDLLTPLVLIPLYGSLFSQSGSKPARHRQEVAFLVFTAFWVLGQGMHLAANSIEHLASNVTGTDLYNLISFYDEVLGHYLWHFGVIALSALLVYRQMKSPFIEKRAITWNSALAGIIYGFTFFAMVVEGQTTPMGVPFAALFVAFCLLWERRKLNQKPLFFLLFAGYLVAVILFAVWGIWQHGFPEFSEVGIIK